MKETFEAIGATILLFGIGFLAGVFGGVVYLGYYAVTFWI